MTTSQWLDLFDQEVHDVCHEKLCCAGDCWWVQL